MRWRVQCSVVLLLLSVTHLHGKDLNKFRARVEVSNCCLMSGKVDLLKSGSGLRLGALEKSERVIALKVAGFRAVMTEEEGD
jgi:hypothetical protein